MGKFDSYYEPPYEPDAPCELCGRDADTCICPECLACGNQGDPDCYALHGLFKMHYQAESLKKMKEMWEEEARYEEQMQMRLCDE